MQIVPVVSQGWMKVPLAARLAGKVRAEASQIIERCSAQAIEGWVEPYQATIYRILRHGGTYMAGAACCTARGTPGKAGRSDYARCWKTGSFSRFCNKT